MQRPLHGVAVADVALDPFDIGSQIVRPALVNLRIERVEHPHVVSGRKQAIDEVRADEAGATCDQDMHLANRAGRRATSGAVRGERLLWGPNTSSDAGTPRRHRYAAAPMYVGGVYTGRAP